MYILSCCALFQILFQITYIRCETEGGRLIQSKALFTSNLKNADKIYLSVKTNQEDQNRRHEHDTKDVQSCMLDFKDHHAIHNFQGQPRASKERLNIENTMNNYYNDENEESTTVKEKPHNNHLVISIDQINRHSPTHSGFRRNKLGLQDYQTNLENVSRKLYARRTHEPIFNEEDKVTGETCVEYKADPTTRSTTEQATTDTSLTAYTNEKDIKTTTGDCGSYTVQSTRNSEPEGGERFLEKEQNKRNERDTKDMKSSMLNFRDRHDIPIKQRLSRVFKERSNIENPMSYDYNEESPSLRREIPKSRLVMKVEEDKRLLPKHSSMRRNKLGPKGYQDDLGNESRKLYARRAHESRYNDEPVVTGDTCVEYKAASSLRSIIEQTTTDTTLAASTTNKGSTKTKTASKGNRKTERTQKGGPGSEVKILENEELNEYDKYMCGLLADTFVNAVLVKVQRSRKIAKELGFSNESDEKCDRCIELKPSKIPDLDTMRASLGKCSRGSDYSLNSSSCENSISDFLDLLLLFEMEQDNSVYSKIRDDSSFIFTDDYDSSIRKENGLENNDNYHNRESFTKDTMEKQHLGDESSEEKNDDWVPNRNYFPGKVKNLPRSHPQDNSEFHDSRHSDVKGNEDFDAEAEVKNSLLKGDKDKNAKDNAEIKNVMQSEDSFNDEDFTEQHEQQHSQSPIRRKYSSNKKANDKEFNGPEYSADTANGNLKKPAKVRTTKGAHSSFREPTFDYGRDVNQYEERQDEDSGYPSQRIQSRVGQYAESYGLSRAGSAYGDMDNSIRRGPEPIKTQSKHNTLRQAAGNTHSRKNNYFNYLSGGYKTLDLNEDGRLYSPYDKLNNWDEVEYQLYPNQPNNGAVDPLETRVLPPTKYYGNGLDDSLRMVKRDTESYDYDLSGFEIPDIEYELY